MWRDVGVKRKTEKEEKKRKRKRGLYAHKLVSVAQRSSGPLRPGVSEGDRVVRVGDANRQDDGLRKWWWQSFILVADYR